MTKRRWYDQHKRLAVCLDSLQDVNRTQRDELVAGIMELIKEESPTLIDDMVMDFPLDSCRRRWYDRNPHLWLVFNGLRYASDNLLQHVTEYIEMNLPSGMEDKRAARTRKAIETAFH